jgi:outer membrane biosynthesis protein TonB
VLGPLEVQRASPGAQPAAPPPGVEVLPAGESGKRRLRDVVLQHRADLERCADPGVAPEPGARGEAVLRLTVDGSGRVTDLRISTAGAEGAPLEACLRSAVQGWRLPAGEPGYTADIPMTLVRSGARP